mmetsp:Transcript_29426/g.77336  ORF Transcript_29426/g.77336 Transcript_29426/m.77336 type:complete len:284 (-) Transcript_29426:253-1104(-)
MMMLVERCEGEGGGGCASTARNVVSIEWKLQRGGIVRGALLGLFLRSLTLCPSSRPLLPGEGGHGAPRRHHGRHRVPGRPPIPCRPPSLAATCLPSQQSEQLLPSALHPFPSPGPHAAVSSPDIRRRLPAQSDYIRDLLVGSDYPSLDFDAMEACFKVSPPPPPPAPSSFHHSSPRPFDVPQSHPRPSSLPIHRRPRLHSPRARSGVGAQQAARHHDLPRRGPRLHLHGHHGRAGQRALAAGRGGGAGVRGGGEARGGGVRAGRLRMRYRALLCATRRRTAVE